ncbi:MAG: hypothetical protein JWR74_2854 [Polaromonas sp.]|nr:hypothetical protein [Polaromonas sp.]
MKPEVIAQVAHEINRAYCASLGDVSQASWAEAPEWQRQSAMAGVAMHTANPNATPADSHVSWLAEKVAAGWVYGPTKDADKKEHPCCVPYDELPAEQKAKDYLFRAVVHQLLAIAPELTVQFAPEIPPDCIAITYIGRREIFTDRLYGSKLDFAQGQTRALPSDLAKKFLRHADCFTLCDLPAAADALQDNTVLVLERAEKVQKDENKKLDDVQFLRDQIANMDKSTLTTLAKNSYGQDLNQRLSAPKLREQLIALVDQYGPV